MRRPGLAVLVVALVLTVVACGEPAVDLEVPAREPGQVVLDQAGILGDGRVEAALREFQAQGRDVVAVTYETEQANRGEANRAARLVLDEWGADIALVAVARPGDFTSTVVDREDPEDRQRFFGLEAADAYAVPRSTRERIVESLVGPHAERNDWPAVFTVAVDELERSLAARAEPAG